MSLLPWLACAVLLTAQAVRAEVREPLDFPSLQSPLAAKRTLMAVALAGPRLVAVGKLGHIVYSADQGQTWTQAKVPVSVDLVAVFFVTPMIGWATGHDGVVLRTGDGGANWTLMLSGRQAAKLMLDYYTARQAAGDPAVKAALEESARFVHEQGARPFLDVWFENEQLGFVVGAWGLILRTADGGKTWVPWLDRVDNPRFNHLNAIRVVDGHPWIAGEQGLLVRLDEDAQRFSAVHSPTDGSLFGLLSGRGYVIVFGLAGRAFVSRDDGHSWVKANSTGGSGLSAGTILPDGRIVLVDTGAGMWISSNDGVDFSAVAVKRAEPLFGIATVAPETVALVGLRGAQRQVLSP